MATWKTTSHWLSSQRFPYKAIRSIIVNNRRVFGLIGLRLHIRSYLEESY